VIIAYRVRDRSNFNKTTGVSLACQVIIKNMSGNMKNNGEYFKIRLKKKS